MISGFGQAKWAKINLFKTFQGHHGPMAAIEAFIKGHYIFVPDPAPSSDKQGPHTVTLTPANTLVLDFNGETRNAAETRFAAFSAMFGDFGPATTIECPKGGGVVLKKTYQNAASNLIQLHKLGFLNDDDFAAAHIRAMRAIPQKARPVTAAAPAGPHADISVVNSVL
jgi:hypothetical protein